MTKERHTKEAEVGVLLPGGGTVTDVKEREQSADGLPMMINTF